LVYRADQLKGARSAGLQGQSASPEALDALLRGSGFRAQRDPSGAVVIVPAAPRSTAPVPAPAARGAGQAPPAAAADSPVTDLATVQVTGSRIPRTQVEGPSPITVITADQISAQGFTNMPEVMRSMTQNNGSTQSPQSISNSDFTPGAQQVDLRGLGPNHTLVLVNGRRLADFPLPMDGGI